MAASTAFIIIMLTSMMSKVERFWRILLIAPLANHRILHYLAVEMIKESCEIDLFKHAVQVLITDTQFELNLLCRSQPVWSLNDIWSSYHIHIVIFTFRTVEGRFIRISISPFAHQPIYCLKCMHACMQTKNKSYWRFIRAIFFFNLSIKWMEYDVYSRSNKWLLSIWNILTMSVYLFSRYYELWIAI